MLKIDVTFDEAAFAGQSKAYVDGKVVPAQLAAVNAAAEAARKAVQLGMVTSFDRPTPFTLNSMQIYPAVVRGSYDPAALLFVMDTQAAYLNLEINGGVRVAGDYATTKAGPLVPGPHAPRDEFGNLPRGYVAQQMADPHVAWIHLRPGGPPTLVRKVPGGKLEILAFVVAQEDFRTPHLPFYDLVTDAVADTLGPVFTQELK